MSHAERLPTLSNSNQLKVMNMVKQGMSIDEAIRKATMLEEQQKKVKLDVACLKNNIRDEHLPSDISIRETMTKHN
jgi:hypothetical protein